MVRYLVLAALVCFGACSLAFAQDVRARCGGVSGKTYVCCESVVKANPSISQCDQERAVFRCAGGKKYVSRNGCGTFTR